MLGKVQLISRVPLKRVSMYSEPQAIGHLRLNPNLQSSEDKSQVGAQSQPENQTVRGTKALHFFPGGNAKN